MTARTGFSMSLVKMCLFEADLLGKASQTAVYHFAKRKGKPKVKFRGVKLDWPV
jgi:hypothetical protein